MYFLSLKPYLSLALSFFPAYSLGWKTNISLSLLAYIQLRF